MAELEEVDRRTPEGGPCLDLDCGCCTAWTQALETLRDHARRHIAGELRLAPCDPECLLCAEIEWQSPQPMTLKER